METTINEWYECAARYEKTLENGMTKFVSEPYLVEACSFTEAEKRFIDEITPYMSGDFEVKAVKKFKIAEMFPTEDADADKWYKAKLSFITLDEKNGVEKRTTHFMMVQAAGFHDAMKRLDEGMKGTTADYEITSIAETRIMYVFNIR